MWLGGGDHRAVYFRCLAVCRWRLGFVDGVAVGGVNRPGSVHRRKGPYPTTGIYPQEVGSFRGSPSQIRDCPWVYWNQGTVRRCQWYICAAPVRCKLHVQFAAGPGKPTSRTAEEGNLVRFLYLQPRVATRLPHAPERGWALWLSGVVPSAETGEIFLVEGIVSMRKYLRPQVLMLLFVMGGLIGGTAFSASGPTVLSESEAAAADARSYANDFGVSLEVAQQRLADQGKIGKAIAALRDGEPATFAGAWVEHTPKWQVVVRMTDAGPSATAVEGYFSDSTIPVTVKRDAPWSEQRTLSNLQAIESALEGSVAEYSVCCEPARNQRHPGGCAHPLKHGGRDPGATQSAAACSGSR